MQILVLLFILPVMAVEANQDVECLKSIKESLEDPENVLTSTWRFDNHSEGSICRFNGVECWHPDEDRVLSLRLSDMGLGGSFPRGLENCTSLTALDLSRNHLSGPLPPHISQLLPLVIDLDLSANYFSGEIPANLANCTFLNDLNLNNNQFQGQIPTDLGRLPRLRSFSAANNHLSGPVPLFTNNSVIKDDYAFNSGLCGGPLPLCDPEQNKKVEKIKFICGFMVGWVVSTLVTLYLGLFYLPDSCSSSFTCTLKYL